MYSAVCCGLCSVGAGAPDMPVYSFELRLECIVTCLLSVALLDLEALATRVAALVSRVSTERLERHASGLSTLLQYLGLASFRTPTREYREF